MNGVWLSFAPEAHPPQAEVERRGTHNEPQVKIREVAQFGSALGSGPRGRGFESRLPENFLLLFRRLVVGRRTTMKIFVKTKPRSKQERVEKIDETHFIVAVKEIPIEGRANKAIIKALADYFDVA